MEATNKQEKLKRPVRQKREQILTFFVNETEGMQCSRDQNNSLVMKESNKEYSRYCTAWN